MSTYPSYQTWQEKERKKAEARATAPQACPYCKTPINQDAHDSRVHYHCGADTCRQRASRAKRRKELQEARDAAKLRINQYAARLPAEQGQALRAMRALLMDADKKHGHEIALAVVEIIEQQRCRHHKISTLVDHARLSLRRANQAEAYVAQMTAMYEARLKEMAQELQLYQQVENKVYDLAEQQLEQQLDQEPSGDPAELEEAGDPDRARTLEILRMLHIQPLGDRTSDELEEGDEE